MRVVFCVLVQIQETEESEQRQCFMAKAGVLLCLSRVADGALKVKRETKYVWPQQIWG